jgi:hypothetical protein
LIDRLPEAMLAHVKEMIDRMLSRSTRDRIRDDETTVVKGTFPSNRPGVPKKFRSPALSKSSKGAD